MNQPDQMPETRGGIVPYLIVRDATKAADFYTKAFGAEVVAEMPPDEQGRKMHIHLYVNGHSLMLCDPFPDHGQPLREHNKGTNLVLPVKGIQTAWKRAVDAGCTIESPLQRMFWGDDYGELRDPFGVFWSMVERPK